MHGRYYVVAGCTNYYVRYSLSTQSSLGHLMAVSEDVEKILRKKKNVGVKSPNMVVPPRLPRMSLLQLRTQGIDVGKRTRRWTPPQAVGRTLQVKHFQHDWRVSDSSQCAQRFFIHFSFNLTGCTRPAIGLLGMWNDFALRRRNCQRKSINDGRQSTLIMVLAGKQTHSHSSFYKISHHQVVLGVLSLCECENLRAKLKLVLKTKMWVKNSV